VQKLFTVITGMGHFGTKPGMPVITAG